MARRIAPAPPRKRSPPYTHGRGLGLSHFRKIRLTNQLVHDGLATADWVTWAGSLKKPTLTRFLPRGVLTGRPQGRPFSFRGDMSRLQTLASTRIAGCAL